MPKTDSAIQPVAGARVNALILLQATDFPNKNDTLHIYDGQFRMIHQKLTFPSPFCKNDMIAEYCGRNVEEGLKMRKRLSKKPATWRIAGIKDEKSDSAEIGFAHFLVS